MQRPWCDSMRRMGPEEIGRPPKVGRMEMGVAGWALSGDGRGRWAQSGGEWGWVGTEWRWAGQVGTEWG